MMHTKEGTFVLLSSYLSVTLLMYKHTFDGGNNLSSARSWLAVEVGMTCDIQTINLSSSEYRKALNEHSF